LYVAKFLDFPSEKTVLSVYAIARYQDLYVYNWYFYIVLYHRNVT